MSLLRGELWTPPKQPGPTYIGDALPHPPGTVLMSLDEMLQELRDDATRDEKREGEN